MKKTQDTFSGETDYYDGSIEKFLYWVLCRVTLRRRDRESDDRYPDISLDPGREEELLAFLVRAIWLKSRITGPIFLVLTSSTIYLHYAGVEVWAIAGGIFSLTGSLFLADGLRMGLSDIEREAPVRSTGATYSGYQFRSRREVIHASERAVNASFGAGLLVFGFILQTVGTLT